MFPRVEVYRKACISTWRYIIPQVEFITFANLVMLASPNLLAVLQIYLAAKWWQFGLCDTTRRVSVSVSACVTLAQAFLSPRLF